MNRQSGIIAYELSEMAAKHPNNTISNALAALSTKIESLGKPFAEQLNDMDLKVLAYYRTEKKKNLV